MSMLIVLKLSRATSAAFLSTAFLVFALAVGSDPASAASAGPFRPFIGDWRGAGRITTNNGQSERISCRATYFGSDGDQSLTQSLVCASDSYRFDVESSAVAEGHNLRGQWQETTRNVQGELTGELGNGDLQGTVSGAGFTARISIRTNGRRQAVAIRPSAGDIASVEVSLARQH
jgi:hypothetical protein